MKRLWMAAGAGLCALGFTVLAAADEMQEYRSEKYGFAMRVPADTRLVEREYGDGWGGLYAEVDGVDLFGAARLGSDASPEEIERFGVSLTGISADHWTRIEEGEDRNGWKWYRIVKAEAEGRLIFGGYGTGPKGSYLLVLRTTAGDFAENRADYDEWIRSVRLF